MRGAIISDACLGRCYRRNSPLTQKNPGCAGVIITYRSPQTARRPEAGTLWTTWRGAVQRAGRNRLGCSPVRSRAQGIGVGAGVGVVVVVMIEAPPWIRFLNV